VKNTTEIKLFSSSIESPIGHWTLVAHETALVSVHFSRSEPEEIKASNAISALAARQLEEYFSKKRTEFALPIDLTSYSEFFRAVWKALVKINYGQMVSYADIAQKLNNPKAVRAVGMANGKNPIPIIVPCHRVIGKDRSLTGYASGLEVKRWLLEHEGAIAATPTLF